MNDKNPITLGSLFDGIGGFPYAGSFYGIVPIWASEILSQAVSVTMRHFPGMEHVGDITKLNGAKLPPVDIITFGSPCQDLSTAGRRTGMKGERSGLFTEAIRIIDEMRCATNGRYPRYACWENVPGAMSSGTPAGSDFQAVLEAFTKTKIPMPVSGRWATAGMVRGGGVNVAWRVLNAQYHGVPQRRRRIFLVCDFRGESAGEILFIEKGMRRDIAPCAEARQGTAAHVERSADGANENIAFACNQRDEVRDLHDISAAVCAQPGMKQQTFIAEDVNCITPWDVQSRRIHTQTGMWPALYGGEGGGNGCAALLESAGVDCLNPWDTQQSRVFTEVGASPTLAGADMGGGRNPAGLVFTENNGTHAQIEILNDQGGNSMTVEKNGQSPTLRHETHGNLPIVSLLEAYPINTQTATRHKALGESTGFGIANNGDPAYTLQETHSHAVAVSVHQNGNGDLHVSDTAKSLTTMSTSSCRNAPLVAHPEVTGTLCASGAGLSRPAGMASEPDLCVAYALQGNMIGRQEHNGPRGSGVSENVSFTLTKMDVPAVASVIPINDKATRHQGGGATRNGDGAGNGLGIGKEGDPAPTLTSGDHHMAAIPINTQIAVRHNALGKDTGFGVGEDNDPAYTLQQAHCHAVATPDNSQPDAEQGDMSIVDAKIASGKNSVGTLMANAGTKMWLGNQEAFSGDFFPIQNYIVRRLTPTECERLQGFPDGWTKIGYDGKEISDSKRYSMLGNSVAVPCVAFIMRGIAGQLRNEGTCDAVR